MRTGKRDCDVAVIGAGPAGLSAAIWCRDLGLKAVVFEKAEEAGGQLLRIYNPITNYPGLRTKDGRELRDLFLRTVESYGIEIRFSTEVTAIDQARSVVLTGTGDEYSARVVVAATGVRRRRLNIPGENELVGKGILESGSRDKELVRGKRVAVIGGGDAALENALILSDVASEVVLIHRKDKFRARTEFVEAVSSSAVIRTLFCTTLSSIEGSKSVEAVRLVDRSTGSTRTEPVDAVLMRIGVEPNSELLGVARGPEGYAIVDSFGRVGEAGLFAIGDVANPFAPTIGGAVGNGATAAKMILRTIR